MKLLLALLSAIATPVLSQSLTDYVDPTIGSGDHGHVFIGANVPFGMINAGPTQLETGWDWCSGYHQSGTKIVGFAQTHLSGTGCSDLGDIAIMPVTGDVTFSREGLATPYSHENEEVRPGYYSVLLGTDKKLNYADGGLQKDIIRTEVTADRRNAMYRITYPQDATTQSVVVDLENGVGDRVLNSRLVFVNDTLCVGYRISHGWANVQHCYFAMRFSRHIADSWEMEAGSHYYRLDFEPSAEPLIVTISLSPVSEFNAMKNMAGPFMTFDAMRAEANEQWNRNLGRIKATFLNDRDRRIFYTAMYHFMVAPQTWDDENGDWRGADNRIYRLHAGQPLRNNESILSHYPFTMGHLPCGGSSLYYYPARYDAVNSRDLFTHLPRTRQVTRVASDVTRNKLYGWLSRRAHPRRHVTKRICARFHSCLDGYA